MPPVAFLALIVIAMLPGAALRLELNFRRSGEDKARPGSERPAPRPELRAAPAGGYSQPPFSPAFGKR